MKKLAILLVSFALFSCSSIQVSYDFDRQADFTEYKTYSFSESIKDLGVGDLNRDRIVKAIETQMAAKGFTMAENPDVVLDIHIKAKQMVSATATTTGAGYPWTYSSPSDKILVVHENQVPSFKFGGQTASEFRLFKWPFIITGNTGNNIEFNTPVTGNIEAISTDTDNQITTITSEGIGLNHFQLDFYGCPIVLDVDGDNEITRQALLLDDNTIQVNGILPSYSEDAAVFRNPFG